MKPAFIDLMQEQGLKYEIVDVMENKEARQKYKVMGVPTIIVTNDGEIVGRVTGSRSREQLLKLIKGE
jgi:thiol-disulfide isomerase/thioredoxin